MSFLLDTNIVSALSPETSKPPVHLVEWLERHSDVLFLSVITVAEIRAGIAMAARRGATRKASNLASWWQALEDLYAPKILPFDRSAARLAGDLTDRARAEGIAPGFADIAPASIALSRNLTLVTRNIKHFVSLGVPLLDPSIATA